MSAANSKVFKHARDKQNISEGQMQATDPTCTKPLVFRTRDVQYLTLSPPD